MKMFACVYMYLDCKCAWYVWLNTGMSEAEKKGCEEIAAGPARRRANFKYSISPERGHHLKHESVWRVRGTTWGGGGGGHAETQRRTLLRLSPLSSGLSVNWITQRMGNQQRQRGRDGETLCNGWPSSIPWHKSPRLLLPWTLWMKVCKAQWCGSAVPSHWALRFFFFIFPSFFIWSMSNMIYFVYCKQKWIFYALHPICLNECTRTGSLTKDAKKYSNEIHAVQTN